MLAFCRCICDLGDTQVLSSRCCMHQVQLCLKDVYLSEGLRFQNELYCLSHLLQQGTLLVKLRRRIRTIIRSKFKVKYSQPNQGWAEYAQNVLDLLFLPPCPAAPHDGDPDC